MLKKLKISLYRVVSLRAFYSLQISALMRIYCSGSLICSAIANTYSMGEVLLEKY